MLSTNKDKFFLIIGILGACFTLLGLVQNFPHPYHVVGSLLLLSTALHYKLDYFIALEIIIIAGHGSILLNISQILQIALPLLLCLQLLTYYFLSGQFNNIFLLTGIVGIAIISIGFSYANQWIFFLGSVFIAAYAFYVVPSTRIALLWAVLNSLFACIAVVKLVY